MDHTTQIILDLGTLSRLPDLLQRLESALSTLETPDVILNTAGAAALLNVSEGEVRSLVASHDLPAYPVGNGWKFSRRALLDWFHQRDQKNIKEAI